jgi:hypothetical protein
MANGNGNGHSNGHANGNGGRKRKAGERKTPATEIVQPTDEELEIRVAYCFNLLAQGFKPWEVRKSFMEEFGVVRRTADNYISRARKQIADQMKVPLIELKNESLALYRALSMDTTKRDVVRTRARALLDDLLGLKSPREHWHSGPKGGDIPIAGHAPQLIVNVVNVASSPEPPNMLPEKAG